MAFQPQKLWLVSFTLPDGRHLSTGHASTREKAAETFRRSLGRNPEAVIDFASIRAVTPPEVDAAIAALRAEDPSRPLADDMGLDTPERIITDPWVVPGSQVPHPETIGGGE